MNPTGLAAGSLTTDGRTDLVVADQGYFSYVGSAQQVNGALHVYLGNANGTFATVTAPTTTATNYTVAALGDLNNDGKLDLIVAGNVTGTSAGTGTPNVYTLLGNGDGTFQAANTLALAGQDGIGATSIALADFKNAGNLGAVVGNPNDFSEVLLGNGDGTFTDALPALGQRPATVATADLLGNGYSEILVGEADTQGQGNSLTVLLNMPSAWTAAVTTTTPTVTVTPSPSSITTAQSTMVTVTVSGASGGATPTGSVTLTSGTYTSAATTLTSGSAVITVPGSSLAVATDTLTATYTPDSTSSSIYNSAMGTNTVTVTAATVASFALTNNGPITFEASATTGNTSTITVMPANGFTGTVNLTCTVTTIPTGATSPATCGVASSVSITGSTAQDATLTVTTTTTTTAGAYAVTVTGISGAMTQTTVVGVTVTAYVQPTFALSNGGNINIEASSTTGNTSTITVTPASGFTGTVNLSCAVTTVPSGAISPATCGVTTPVSITGTAAQTATLTVTTTSTTTAGAYAVTVTGISGALTQTTNVGVTVTAYIPPPTFALTNSGSINIEASATTGNTSTITVTPANGFTGAVSLTCAVTTTPPSPTSPATCGVTNSVTVTGATAQAATLTVTTTSTTTAGNYAVTVTGISGAITQMTTVNVAVTAAVTPSFALTNSGAITISSPGATTGNTATITVTPSGGFTGSVALTATLARSPSGAKNPPTFSFGSTSPVTITGPSAAAGTLTVSTTSKTTAELVRPSPRGVPWYLPGGATLACLLLFGIPARCRRWRKTVGILVLLVFLAGGVVSCGRVVGGTMAGAYTITVTGTSGTMTQSTTVSLTVN